MRHLSDSNRRNHSLRRGVYATALLASLIATGVAAQQDAKGARFMVVSANAHATEAGHAVLKAGGSAVDAAIAVQAALTVVEPQSSGIGGGLFLVHYDRKSGKVTTYDGRETAPAGAKPDQFVGPDGKPLSFREASTSGIAVGVPGAVRALELAHKAHGRIRWPDLFKPGMALARDGFDINPRLAAQILEDKANLEAVQETKDHFFLPDGTPRPAGARLFSPRLGDALARIAAQGADGFYTGAIARDIVEAVTKAPKRPGSMTLADLADYKAVERPPVCAPYRAYRLCGMGPPSSGGIAVIQILGLIEPYPLGAMAPGDDRVAHLLAEAGRFAFADRDHYVGDPGFVSVPTEGLIDRRYIADRSLNLDSLKALGIAVPPGEPPRRQGALPPAHVGPEMPGTSHVSIVDGEGNAVAMTVTIETIFGSRLMAHGFLLNNQLTDFSFLPEVDGRPVANRLAAGKRPRSSMAPTVVLEGETVKAVAGSAGGARIIGHVARTLVALLDQNLAPKEALALPHVLNRNGPTEIEKTADKDFIALMEARGHKISVIDIVSGLTAIVRKDGALLGGADPRRDGIALGE
ncbi:MAG: gamma-glutamyltransferase [Alphaproteobacteria bacterium]|nr:gamma-glutamyltransferase [Alphaproteobacteria bacterium]